MNTTGSGNNEVIEDVQDLWARLDPVPAGLTESIKYALSVRLLEAEVAELVRVPELAARGEVAEMTRTVSFAGSSIRLMVSVMSIDGGGVRLDCWVTTPGALVELRSTTGAITGSADEHGRLSFDEVQPGAVHFVLWQDASQQGTPVITPTIEL